MSFPVPGLHAPRAGLRAPSSSTSTSRRVAAFTCLVLAGVPAHAQVAALDPIVVTATRTPLPLSQVLADMSVLTREDIERKGAGSVADVLRGAPGIELSRNGGPGGTTSLFLRGGESRFTMVLVDGVRVDSQATGGAAWEAIALSQVERIEILRGPASALYGSDAIGGVVQIFTRPAGPGLAADLGLGIGNLGTTRADASLRGTQGAVDFSLSAAAERSDGFNAIVNPANSSYVADRDGYKSRSASARVGLKLSDAHRLEVSALVQRLDAQYDAFASQADDRSRHDLDSVRAAWVAQWHKDWRSQLSVGQATDRYESRPSPYLSETRVRSYAWQNDYAIGAHSLNATLERREDRLDNSGLTASATPGLGDRQQNSLGGGYAWRDAGRALQLQVRQDRDSEFGHHGSGALAGGVDLGAGWRLQASAGTAFRAPTLYQRFSEYGNAALKPETSRDVEASLKYAQAGREFSATAYRNRIADLITFGAQGVCASAFGCYRNTAQARLQGLGLQARSQVAGVRLNASIDLQSPKDASTGRLLARRSRQHLSLQADTDVAGWALGAQLLASGKRFDNAANTIVLGGYSVVNVDAQYRITPQWRLLLRVDNAFDRDYQTARDYATAPRTGFVGLRWTPL